MPKDQYLRKGKGGGLYNLNIICIKGEIKVRKFRTNKGEDR